MNSLTIYINNECNLNCSYCSVKKWDIKLKWSYKIENIIESIVKQEWIKKRIWIMWWEPLLNKEFIINLINYINKLKLFYPEKDIFITSIPTNWTIYNKEFYELLKDNNIELQFSVDNFLENIYDEKRIHKSIKNFNLYKIISKNIEKYKSIYWKTPRINITLSECNINNLFELIKYYIEVIWIKWIYYCPIIWVSKKIIWLKFIKEQIKIFDYYINNVCKYKFEIMPIEDILKNYLSWYKIKELSPCWLWKEPIISYNWYIYSCDLIASKWIIDETYIVWTIEKWIDFEKMNKNHLKSKIQWNTFKEKFNIEKMFCLSYWISKEEADDSKLIFEYIYKIPFLWIKKLSPEIIKYLKDKYWLYEWINLNKVN